MAKSSRKPKQQQQQQQQPRQSSTTMVLSRNGGFSLIASNSPSPSSRSTPLKNLHQHTNRPMADEAEEMLLYQGVGLSPAHSHQESSNKVSPTHHQRGMAGNQRVEKTTLPRLFPSGVRNANNDEAVYHEPFQSRASTSPIRFHPQGDESSSSSTTIPAVHLLTKGSVLDNASNTYTGGRHASLIASLSKANGSSSGLGEAATLQLREGSLAGQKVNYLDSGYSEEDTDQQITSCLMQTASGSIYIPGNLPKNLTVDSRLEYRLHHSNHSPPDHTSPAKDLPSHSMSDRNPSLQLSHAETPFLPPPPPSSKRSGDPRKQLKRRDDKIGPPWEKNFIRNCSWKCIAIFFVLLAVILGAVLITVTAASNFIPESDGPSAYPSAKACAVLAESEDEGQDISTSSQQQLSVSSMGTQLPRNLPPDGTSFRQIALGKSLNQAIPAYGYWNIQFYQSEASYVNMDLSVPRGASVGLYARRNGLPTHTNYDIMEVIKGFEDSRSRRSSRRSVSKSLPLFLTEGHWFISFYNDYGDAQTLGFMGTLSQELTEGCPKGCNGKGDCVAGRCHCQSGHSGNDCSQDVCPVLCNGHGDYVNGECVCQPGWKGKECHLRHEECEITDCNGHGHCVEGLCHCIKGFTGEFCEKTDCIDPTCSNHGFCVEGECVCKKGWKGDSCHEMDEEARQCLPNCNGHGRFDLESQVCHCSPGWTGQSCAKRVCNLDCGEHGSCEDDACVCREGWGGPRCEEKTCDPRCSMHGQCKNGTCLCVAGWNGVHCTLEGCPRQCSNHGSCKTNFNSDWYCQCQDGWEGDGCEVELERECNNDIDDDQDGLTDCEDPECCASTSCQDSELCATVPRPIEILLQRQPPAATASFFQKMRFIIEEGSLQRYAKNTAFNESIFWNYFNQSRVAVIRGRVMTSSGRGLAGVRISHENQLIEGYTMTQEDGWFDFMVNGGGAATLRFGKNPFPPTSRSFFVPWNEVIVIDPVVMFMRTKENDLNRGSLQSLSTSFPICKSHNYEVMRPVILASWRLSQYTQAKLDKSEVLAESRVLQEVVEVPNTQLKLVYSSAKAEGFSSTIELRLTPSTIPDSLKLIHLRITIEGELFEKTFEADPNLKYTYAWRRLNVYRQRVYGVTTAVVKVGYSYSDCPHTIWDVQTKKILGQNLKVSHIGGWDFHIHHRYNHQEGILYKGDGSTVFLKERPKLMTNLIGDGQPRESVCKDLKACLNGPLDKARLLSPIDLVAAPDGSVIVGDYDLIRRIRPDGTISTVLKFPSSDMAYRYNIAIHPSDGSVLISDPETHRIMKIIDLDQPKDVTKNWEPMVGSGIRCLPGDEDECGDGGLAKEARLIYPKGLAVNAQSELFFADGTKIRKVDVDGIITTVLGSNPLENAWRPQSCSGFVSAHEVQLRWPTKLAINPLDNAVHFIDDNLIVKLTTDGRVHIVAGRPLHCSRLDQEGHYLNFASQTTLVSPSSLSFAPSGELFIAESDARRINRVSVVNTNARISIYAGRDSKCNCQESDCTCLDDSNLLALEAVFGSVSAIAVGPDGQLFISDQANRRIQAIKTSIPSLSEQHEYHVYSPEDREIYIFNRFGLHLETKEIGSNRVYYKFSYSVSTSNGKLIGISDSTGGKIKIIRDYSGQVSAIENSLQQRFELALDMRKRMLTQLKSDDNWTTALYSYHRSTELIQARIAGNGEYHAFYYDRNGRLEEVITPTGDKISLVSDLEVEGAKVNITKNARNVFSLLIHPGVIQVRNGQTFRVARMRSDRSFIVNSESSSRYSLRTMPFHLLDGEFGLAESFPVPSGEKTDIGRDTVNSLEWQYTVSSQDKYQIEKKLKINGKPLFSIAIHPDSASELVRLEDAHAILNISGGPESRRISMQPSGLFSPVLLDRNQFGQPLSWRWGELVQEAKYDRLSRVQRVLKAKQMAYEYEYFSPHGRLPSKVTVGSGGEYHMKRTDGHDLLKAVVTPLGHIYGFNARMGFGQKIFEFHAPWASEPAKLFFNTQGDLVAKSCPNGFGKIIYHYEEQDSSRLKMILAGALAISYHYYPTTGLLKGAELTDVSTVSVFKAEWYYHVSLLKEYHQIHRVQDHAILSDIFVRYQYDGSARVSGIDVVINKETLKTIAIKYNDALGQLEATQDLRFQRQSLRKTIIETYNKDFVLTKDLDTHGRAEKVTIYFKGLQKFELKLGYDERGRLSNRHSSLQDGKDVKLAFAYNLNDQLESQKSKEAENFVYSYDANGNIVMIERPGVGPSSVLGYDKADRLVMVDNLAFVSYDDCGFAWRRGDQRYEHNVLGQMVTAVGLGKFKIHFYYDDRGRLIAKSDQVGNVVQYIYANLYHPWQVSHVHFPKAARTYHFIYDDAQHMMAMDTSNGERYYFATDQVGSPLAVFTANGDLIKEIYYTPFGQVVFDSNPSFALPLGFKGGLIDQYTNLVHLKNRVYDPYMGLWLTPEWDHLAQGIKSPFDIYTYRFFNNDPINEKTEGGAQSQMTELSDWLELFGMDIKKNSGMVLSNPIDDKADAPEFKSFQSLDLTLGLERKLKNSMDFLHSPGLLKTVSLTSCNDFLTPDLGGQTAVEPSPFGKGILISDINGKALVTLIPGVEGDVAQSVFASVLNASSVHDASHSGNQEFFFLKDDENSFASDLQELDRLSGLFNITKDAIRPRGRQLCAESIRSPSVKICLIYDTERRFANRHIYRASHKQAVRGAWLREFEAVKMGHIGEWTPSERDELLSTGEVKGFQGLEVHSVHRFPQLLGESSNIILIRDSDRRRTKGV